MKKIVLSLLIISTLSIADTDKSLQKQNEDIKISQQKNKQVFKKTKRDSYQTRASSVHKKLHRSK